MRLHLRSGGWMRWALVVMVLAASTALVSSTKSPFTERDKAFYADAAAVNFVRPGLVMTITAVDIATDGTVKATFKLADPKGVALDREGILTPGAVSTSFLIATIPNGGTYYQDYNTRLKLSTYAPTAGKTARQAGTDSGGSYAKSGDNYVYTFGTKLPASFDKTATHTVAIYGSRNLSEFDMGTYYASNVYNFVPDGTAVKTVRNIIDTASCNKCHDNLSFHGGSRIGVDLCILCHTPGYTVNGVAVPNTNPETDRQIDMTDMIHKIHMGSSLPSVIGGKPYQIVGYGNAVSDWSGVTMPSKPNNCAWCHDKGNEKAKQKDNWLTNPSRRACGACHDTVNFATGENHANLPQVSDSQCKNCHVPQGEIDFDASIRGAHVVEQDSALVKGVVAKIVAVDNAKAGQKPVVTFSIVDRKGNPLTVADVIPGAGRGRLALTLAGPSTDYVGISGTGTNGYVQETVTVANTTGSAGQYKYNFTAAIPADAKGTWLMGIEGRSDEKLLAGTLKERVVEVGIPNDFKYFAVDSSTVAPRRTIAVTATCNNCHYKLSLHGENRNDVMYCVVCHNPGMTDAARRPATAQPNESISMASMIHRIHTGRDQTRDFTIYGFGNSANNFNNVEFPPPASTRNCTMCHNAGTQNLPVAATSQVTDPRGWIPSAYPGTAACLACHSGKAAASHALANTTPLGESCEVCHGTAGDFSVAKVHAQ